MEGVCKRWEGTGGRGECEEVGGIWTRMEDSEHRPRPPPSPPRPQENARRRNGRGSGGRIRTGGSGRVGGRRSAAWRAAAAGKPAQTDAPPPRIGRPGADQDGQTEPRPGQRMRSAPAQAWIRPKRGAVRRESGLGLKMRQNRPKILQKYRLHRLNKTNHHHLTELTCFTFRWLNASSPESSTG